MATKAIIIGAGIGGLSAAIVLRRLGFDIAVFEQADEIRPVGAAISVWSNGVKALNWLGLGDQTAALGGRMDSMAYREWASGTPMCEFSLAPVTAALGQRPYPIARADLQAMLFSAVGADHIHLGKSMTSLTEVGNQVHVAFADGTLTSGGLVIAADGARSHARTYVLGHPVERRYAGYVNINGLIPIDSAIGPPDQWTTYVGHGKRVSVMPVAGDRFYFFLDLPGPADRVPDRTSLRDHLSAEFQGWAPGVQRLIQTLDIATTNTVPIYDVDPFRTWVRGRVALLGDAAHNTTPDLGQGGCMALEDAVVLERVLGSTSLGIEDALQRYQDARVDRTSDLVRRARKRSDITHGTDPAATERWYEELRHEDGSTVIGGLVGNMIGNPLE